MCVLVGNDSVRSKRNGAAGIPLLASQAAAAPRAARSPPPATAAMLVGAEREMGRTQERTQEREAIRAAGRPVSMLRVTGVGMRMVRLVGMIKAAAAKTGAETGWKEVEWLCRPGMKGTRAKGPLCSFLKGLRRPHAALRRQRAAAVLLKRRVVRRMHVNCVSLARRRRPCDRRASTRAAVLRKPRHSVWGQLRQGPHG